MSKLPTTIIDASSAVATLPATRQVQLSGGRSVTIHRLSWLQFELLWTELATLLAALLADPGGARPASPAPSFSSDSGPRTPDSGLTSSDSGPPPPDSRLTTHDAGPSFADALLSAPAVALQLAALSCDETELTLADWPYDDVLTVAAAALQLSFIESQGVRSFFAALGQVGPGA